MPDPNNMTAFIVVDDSQEEAYAKRHEQRSAKIQATGERTARAQSDAWRTSTDKIIAQSDRVGQSQNTMFAQMERMTREATRAFGATFDMVNRFMVKSAEMIGSAAVLAVTIKGTAVAWGASTGAAIEHTGVMEHLVGVYRAVRLALSPTAFTATTLAVGALAEYAIQLAVARDRIIKQDALVSAQTKQSYFNVSTFGEMGTVAGSGRNAYQTLFQGKSAYDIPKLVDDFKALRDPIDKANFAFQHFGANAAEALPLLGDRMKFDTEKAYELSAMLSSKTRESLDLVAVVARRPADAMRGLADEIRYLRESAKESIVIRVAWVVQSGADAMNDAERARQQLIAQGKNGGFTTGSPVGGIDIRDWKPPLPSDLAFSLGAKQAAAEAQQRLQDAVGDSGLSSRVVGLSESALARNRSSAEGLSRQMTDAQSKLHADEENLKRAIGTALESTVRLSIVQDERTISALKPLVEGAKRQERLNEEIAKLREEGMPFIQVGSNLIRGSEISKANRDVHTPTLFNRPSDLQRLGFEENALRLAREAQPLPEGMSFMGQDVFVSPSASRAGAGLGYQLGENGEYTGGGTSAEIQQARGAGFLEQVKQERQIMLSALNAETAMTSRLIEIRNGTNGEAETARTVAALREAGLKAEFAMTQDVVRYRESSLQNEYDLQIKLAELDKRQHDEIAKTAGGLWNTLLTNPRGFGGQLASTVRASLLHPITEGLGNMTANVIQPLVGSIGDSLRGLFGGSQGLQDIRLENGAMPVVVRNFPGAGGGNGGGSWMGGFSPASWARSPLAAAALAGGLMLGGQAAAAPSFSPAGVVSSSIDYNDGTGPQGFGQAMYGDMPAGDVSTPPFMPSGSSGSASSHSGGGILGALGQLFKGGGGSNQGGGIAGILKNLKGINWGGFTHSPISVQMGGPDGATTTGGKINGVNGVAGAALLTGGSMLAQQGLLGSSRGTWAGVGMGALGGAAIGFQMGGPLGALIGGAAGGLIGLGEKIAGVESPEREAHRLILSTYGIDVAVNSGTIKQIVEMSKQYGGSISMTIRTPEVRQLLQLYAESTGQHSNLFLQNPMAAHLSQQGGQTYQGLSYNNGTGYTFGSGAGLPTLGSGAMIPTGNPFGPGGGMVNHIVLDADATVDLISTGALRGIQSNPAAVSASANSGYSTGSARLQTASTLLAPNVITS
jgi:hypothetical protein